MTFRKWLSLALVAAAFGAERFAYFATRGFVGSAMGGVGGMPPARIGSAMTLSSLLMIVGLFAGAGASFALGPRLTAAIAAFLAAIGYFAFGMESFVGGALLFSFAAGAFRVCPFAAAAELMDDLDGPAARGSPRRFALLTAFAFFLLAASYFASNVARSGGTAFLHAMGFRTASFLNGALAILAAMLAGVSFAVSSFGRPAMQPAPPQAPYRAAEPPPAAASPPSLVPGLVAAALAAAVFGATWSFASPFSARDAMTTLTSLFSVSSLSAVMNVAGITSVFSAYLGFVVWIWAGATRSSASPITTFAIGAIIIGVGMVPVLAGTSLPSMGVLGLGVALVGIGEPLVSGPLLGFASQALRGRAAAFGIAAVSAMPMVAAMIATPLASLARTPLALLFALVAIAIGVAAAAMARRAQRALFG